MCHFARTLDVKVALRNARRTLKVLATHVKTRELFSIGNWGIIENSTFDAIIYYNSIFGFPKQPRKCLDDTNMNYNYLQCLKIALVERKQYTSPLQGKVSCDQRSLFWNCYSWIFQVGICATWIPRCWSFSLEMKKDLRNHDTMENSVLCKSANLFCNGLTLNECNTREKRATQINLSVLVVVEANFKL